jgi:hypothetical protein
VEPILTLSRESVVTTNSLLLKAAHQGEGESTPHGQS